MNWNKLYLLGICVVLICSTGPLAKGEQSEQDQEKMMEAYMMMMTVTQNHTYLKERFVGDWDVHTTAWMEPGAEPEKAQNASHAELILGGRFLKVDFKGQMMGEPFEGLQIIGFDNLKQKFITFWIDSSSTAFFLTEGTKEGMVTTETGEWPDPMTGGTTKVKMITTSVSVDEFVFEMFMTGPDGMEFKSMENRSVRKK